MRIRSICAWALAATLSANTALAQTGIYALFTGANLDTTPSTATQIFGPTFGFLATFPHPYCSSAATSAVSCSTAAASSASTVSSAPRRRETSLHQPPTLRRVSARLRQLQNHRAQCHPPR